MKKNEAQFQTKFGHWLKNNFKKTAPFELKYEKGGTFNIKQWVLKQPKQPRSLLAAFESEEGLYYKLSDMSADRKPFDCFFFYKTDAYLVIYWEKYDEFSMIHIKKLLPFFGKSITYYEASKLNERHNT